ncbi:MAG: ATP-grasp domain-containing protein [Pseudomonadota bacterium]
MKVLIAYSRKKILYDRDGNPNFKDILSTVFEVEAALCSMGHEVTRGGLNKNPTRFLSEFFTFRPDVIFNLCEDVNGDTRKETSAAALYELLGVPFTGNGVLPLAVCLDKAMTKRVLQTANIPTPPFAVLTPRNAPRLSFPLPAMVKPQREDGSLGITARSVVGTRASLARRVRYVEKNFKQPALVEQYIPGREFQVALLGHRKPRILAVAELSYKGMPGGLPRICTYAAKWNEQSTYFKHTVPVVPARVGRKLESELCSIAARVFDVFDLRGYARVDFRVRDDVPYVIDVNPNPDISSDAGFARAARHAGLDYAQLVDGLVRLALKQKKNKRVRRV